MPDANDKPLTFEDGQLPENQAAEDIRFERKEKSGSLKSKKSFSHRGSSARYKQDNNDLRSASMKSKTSQRDLQAKQLWKKLGRASVMMSKQKSVRIEKE